MDGARSLSSFTFRKPALTGRHAAIAKAAAAAGFDVTDTTNLINLIDAIRNADRALLYPDHYKGSGRYESYIYPDHWPAAEMHQQRVMREYRDLGNIPSMPASNARAQRILREELDDDAVFYSARRTLSGASREPLGARMSNKRTADCFTPRPSSKIRKIKEDHTPIIKSSQSTQKTIFDLTQEENAIHTAARLCSSRSPLRDITNYRSMLPGRSVKKEQESQQFHQQSVRTTTNVSLYKIHQNLKLSQANIEKDREVLRERWELDVDLQLQTVTDDLQTLNEYFSRAENATKEAIAVVEGLEERLL